MPKIARLAGGTRLSARMAGGRSTRRSAEDRPDVIEGRAVGRGGCLGLDQAGDRLVVELRQLGPDFGQRQVLALEAPDQAQPGEMTVRVARPGPDLPGRRQQPLGDVVADVRGDTSARSARSWRLYWLSVGMPPL